MSDPGESPDHSPSGEQLDIETWVYERLDTSDLDQATQYTIVAAISGEADLDAALEAGSPAPQRPDISELIEEPTPAFLSSVTVEGFRGIGSAAKLTLQPRPGLTVVAGRNGSGKSSFAEALEFTLTGSTQRGTKKSDLWGDHWRNLHRSSPTRITVGLAVGGVGPMQVGASWEPGADISSAQFWWSRTGFERQAGLHGLGWTRPLELYGPMLSYDGLGGLLDSARTKLFDAIEGFLGLEKLTAANARLTERVRILGEPEKGAKAKKSIAKQALAGLQDDRAVEARRILGKHSPDLEAAAALVANADPGADAVTAGLIALSDLSIPSADAVAGVADELRTAAQNLIDVTGELADLESERSAILMAALDLHESHGDQDCPVCGRGRLDAAWIEQARTLLAETRQHTEARSAAHRRLTAVRSAARDLIQPVPQCLLVDDLVALDLVPARQAWTGWAAAQADDRDLEAHLLVRYNELMRPVVPLRDMALAALAERQTAWSSAAVAFVAWIDAARHAEAADPKYRVASEAREWLKDNLAALRNDRLAPIADQARQIWAALRQESNVDLGSITLLGSGSQRRVDLRAQVDGEDAGALAVMSQGELHALALALFIPRATSPSSPFGFLVLDDPIQAMDPTKVDGFAQVLVELAGSRQVVVFTHDDRLPAAIRAMALPATIVEITRDAASEISIAQTRSPAQRYLADARTVAGDEELQDQDVRRIVPGLCRLAVESACQEKYFSRKLSAGARRQVVESDWSDMHETRRRLMAALEKDQVGFEAWLDKPYRRRALGIVTSAAHDGLRGDIVSAVRDVESTVRDIRQ